VNEGVSSLLRGGQGAAQQPHQAPVQRLVQAQDPYTTVAGSAIMGGRRMVAVLASTNGERRGLGRLPRLLLRHPLRGQPAQLVVNQR
jgi:hypothetical protein